MEKCILCNKMIEKNKENLCYTCREFLKWKYKRKLTKRVKLLKESMEKFEEMKTKFWRAK